MAEEQSEQEVLQNIALDGSEARREAEIKLWQELNDTATEWADKTKAQINDAFAVFKAAPPDEEKPDEPEADPEADGEGDDPDAGQVSEASVDVPPSIRKLIVNLQQGIAKAFRRDSDELNSFKVIRHKSGTAHWIAVWSNNFEDRDGEIFTAKAIDAYVQRVDTGIVPPPELWVWHAGKDTAIGGADWVARHGHFLMASGQFYGSPQAQKAQDYYTKHAKNTGISHGFTFPADKFDGKHFHAFNTFEISLLPRGAEANLYTSLEGVKAMAVDEKKRQYLETVFDGDKEQVDRILSSLDQRGKALEELAVEYKDFVGEVETPASKDTPAHADKGVSELLLDVLDSSAQPIEAATAAMKAARETKAANAELEKRLKAVEDELKLRPRASQSDATLLDTESEAGKALKAKVDAQMKQTDTFWGTEVTATP